MLGFFDVTADGEKQKQVANQRTEADVGIACYMVWDCGYMYSGSRSLSLISSMDLSQRALPYARFVS